MTSSTPPQTDLADNRLAEDGHGARMSLFEHFDELRQRIMYGFIAAIAGTLIGSLFAGQVLGYLAKPYLSLREGSRLQIIDPTGTVVAYFRVALLIGLTIAIPILTYQLVMFLLPALDRRQRRFFLSALPAAFLLFLVGLSFAWFVLIPPALTFLQGFQEGIFVTEWEAGRYITFVTSLLFWIGLAFETPLVLFILSLMGFVTPRPLIKNWRLAVVISAVAAAMITPTIDPVNMFLVMGPLMVLYVISIGLVAIGIRLYRRRIGNPNYGKPA
ncbi:MAG: twin-arginine translocase subunit TatC [Chloroflexota bacterium]